MAHIYKSFSKIFGLDNSEYESKKSNTVSKSNNIVNKIVNTQPRNTHYKKVNTQPKKAVSKKNNIAKRKQNALKYGPKLSKLSNSIAQKTSEESKVLAAIELLKYHPEKESEIMAKYGKLLKKHRHLYTDKNAYGKKKSKKAKRSKKI